MQVACHWQFAMMPATDESLKAVLNVPAEMVAVEQIRHP
jgi:hypothetical protein